MYVKDINHHVASVDHVKMIRWCKSGECITPRYCKMDLTSFFLTGWTHTHTDRQTDHYRAPAFFGALMIGRSTWVSLPGLVVPWLSLRSVYPPKHCGHPWSCPVETHKFPAVPWFCYIGSANKRVCLYKWNLFRGTENYYGRLKFRGVPIFMVFVEGPINEFQYPQNGNFHYEL